MVKYMHKKTPILALLLTQIWSCEKKSNSDASARSDLFTNVTLAENICRGTANEDFFLKGFMDENFITIRTGDIVYPTRVGIGSDKLEEVGRLSAEFGIISGRISEEDVAKLDLTCDPTTAKAAMLVHHDSQVYNDAELNNEICQLKSGVLLAPMGGYASIDSSKGNVYSLQLSMDNSCKPSKEFDNEAQFYVLAKDLTFIDASNSEHNTSVVPITNVFLKD